MLFITKMSERALGIQAYFGSTTSIFTLFSSTQQTISSCPLDHSLDGHKTISSCLLDHSLDGHQTISSCPLDHSVDGHQTISICPLHHLPEYT